MSRQQYLREKRGPYCNPDTTPVEIPEWAERPLTLKEEMARFFREQTVVKALQNEGIETEEEANDFDMPDVDDLDFGLTNGEVFVMEEEFIAEMEANQLPPDTEGASTVGDIESSSLPNQAESEDTQPESADSATPEPTLP
jgi:hypothetical protein